MMIQIVNFKNELFITLRLRDREMLRATSYGIIIFNSFFKHYLLTTSLKFLEYFPCLYVYIFFILISFSM